MTDIVELPDTARRFAEEYLIDFKVAKAAERAKISSSFGHLLMQDPRVEALIREGRRRLSERVNISIDNVLENLRVMTVVNVSDYFEDVPITTKIIDLFGNSVTVPTGEFYQRMIPIGEWTDEMKFALKSMKHGKYGVEITLHDKKATTELIGKHYGVFTDKVEVTGKDGAPLIPVTKDMDAKTAAEAYASTLQAGKADP